MNLSKTLSMPFYQTEGSAAVDLMACFDCGEKILKYCENHNEDFYPEVDQEVYIMPMDRVLIPTGLRMALPKGYKFNIQSRSGLQLKNGLIALQGLIDEDYRGVIGIIIINLGNSIIALKHGHRIAQGYIEKVEQFKFIHCDKLDSTERGINGFGHTGI